MSCALWIVISVVLAAQGADPHSRKLKRVTITGKDLELAEVFRTLAEVSELNIILPDSARGKVTLNLKNVTWDVALDSILRVSGLKAERHGNVLELRRPY